MSRLNETEQDQEGAKLPVRRKWLVFAAAGGMVCLLLLFSVFIFSRKTEAKTAAASTQRKVMAAASAQKKDSPFSVQLRREIAFLKRQKTLHEDTVKRYRNIMFSLPERLSAEETALLEEYGETYRALQLKNAVRETESQLTYCEKIIADRKKQKLADQKQLLLFLTKKAPVVSVKKKTNAGKKKTVKIETSVPRITLDQFQLEAAEKHRRIYALTSRRIKVVNSKEIKNFASEFARAETMFSAWLKEKRKQIPKSSVDRNLKDALAQEEVVLNLLKDCRAVHEMSYNGGEKMKGVRLGRFQILNTNWKGIDFIDRRDKFESRLKIQDLNYGVKMHLAAAGAVRAGKASVKINDIPLLAYYHVLTGDAAIPASPGMKLTATEKQSLIDWFASRSFPDTALQPLRKTASDSNNE